MNQIRLTFRHSVIFAAIAVHLGAGWLQPNLRNAVFDLYRAENGVFFESEFLKNAK